MLERLRKSLFGGSKKSKDRAKSRLHFVLVQDRAGLTNEEMAEFKQEIIGVIEKYFVVDKKAFDISYQRESDSTTLIINSPVVVSRKEGPKGIVGAKHETKAANKNKGSKAKKKGETPATANV